MDLSFGARIGFYKFISFSVFRIITTFKVSLTTWPSGLRRNVKAVVFIGVGSNPTVVIFIPNVVPINFRVHTSKYLLEIY